MDVSTSNKSSAFISYHHNDKFIGETLADQLEQLASNGAGKPCLHTFLDARDIDRGVPWKPIIDENLMSCDWLVVIFTGEQSVYSGYEIGTFLHFHQTQAGATPKPRGKPQKTRLMGLYDVDREQLPVVLRDTQHSAVPHVDTVADTHNVELSSTEASYWYTSELGQFLIDFCAYNNLYVPANEKKQPGNYQINIALAAKKIANAFAVARGTDVKSETPTQIGFELTIRADRGQSFDAIPDSATVAATSLFFNILGLMLPLTMDQAPNTTWGELKKLLETPTRPDAPWLHKVEADVVRAAKQKSLSDEDVTVRSVNGKVYRPILVRHKLFFNGDRRFYLLFVETLDRRFAGDERTSLLLTGLILASRWRFTYFEKWIDTRERVFGADIALGTFQNNCRQLFYNIDWIEHESAEFGTSDTQALVAAFGQLHKAKVEGFFKDWDGSRRRLYAEVPGLDAVITTDNRELVRKAILAFLDETRIQNAEFLDLSVKTYSQAVSSELARDK